MAIRRLNSFHEPQSKCKNIEEGEGMYKKYGGNPSIIIIMHQICITEEILQ